MDQSSRARELMRAIDEAVQKSEKARITNIAVRLCLSDYRLLISLKGLNYDPASHTIESAHEDRPVKVYRDRPLHVLPSNGGSSVVMGTDKNGNLAGYAVARSG